MQDPDDPSKQALRVTYDLPLRKQTKGVLLSIGRHSGNDILLPKGWSKQNRCYFDLQPRTNEVLLHDTSRRNNTSLRYDDGIEQIQNKTPRQCVVLLDRESIFRIGGREGAEFLLKTWKVQNPEVYAQKRQSFLSAEGCGPYEEVKELYLEGDAIPIMSGILQACVKYYEKTADFQNGDCLVTKVLKGMGAIMKPPADVTVYIDAGQRARR
jgi:hypothetical protein